MDIDTEEADPTLNELAEQWLQLASMLDEVDSPEQIEVEMENIADTILGFVWIACYLNRFSMDDMPIVVAEGPVIEGEDNWPNTQAHVITFAWGEDDWYVVTIEEVPLLKRAG